MSPMPCRTSSMQTALIDTKFFSHRIKLMAEVFPGTSPPLA